MPDPLFPNKYFVSFAIHTEVCTTSDFSQVQAVKMFLFNHRSKPLAYLKLYNLYHNIAIVHHLSYIT